MPKIPAIARRAPGRIHPRRLVFAILGMALAALSTSASAASLLLWPVHPVFEADEPAAALWIENRGESTAWLQVRVVGWEQQDGENRYPAQQSVVASPPMLEVGSGERHLVRLVRQVATPAGTEQAWRIILDEIPTLENRGATDEPKAGVNLQMRYSLPLFSLGEGLADADETGDDLRWRLVDRNGATQLEISNRGERHVRLTQVVGSGSRGDTTIAQGLLGYVLPESTQRWPLPDGVDIDSLTAKLNGQAPVTLVRDGN
ncbi:molecular chaperone [Salinicola halophilus]|uniref:fimbrial biogenesis chaperone n=1 Tax=Salinicola halophilus TaxID=184065 RepID=UPI000DA1AD14|nr:fimbria/pilus periplasmic chaperone [Salinicola halophilus]